MPIVRWDPFVDLVELSDEIGRWLPSEKRKRFVSNWYPSIDVKDTEKEIILKADIPGMKMEDINIAVNKDQISISGERKMEQEEKGKDFVRIERSYGSFYRTFDIATPIKEDEVKATYKNGVLEIVLPKAEAKPAKKIEIKEAK